jgi:branched-chain amino acid aminotransferase
LFVITSPVGPYYKTGFKPVALEADPNKVRAWPGGVGQYKLGGNYAPGILPQMQAANRGFQQNLWLFGEEHWLTEVGTMNLFVALQKDNGGVELVTPPLNGMILPGVTRDSILGLARDHVSGKMPIAGLPADLQVTEREINMGEFEQASKDGRLLEVFGAGTAAVVSPVDRVGYMGRDIHIPAGKDGAGDIAKAMLKTMTDIQLGKVEHPWSVLVDDII